MASIAPSLSMRQHGQRITWFVTVQLIALIGWIIVQSTFTLSPWGQNIPFAVIMVIETIWWIATLVIMFVLFRRLYNSFIQAAIDLEEANKRLRDTTNSILTELRTRGDQSAGENPT
ncbi:MAG TPA: hypothetical protein VKV40_20260 [Ktedonobacteraceae bacterium]|nr:hypothetical protein [Ktedonobacteraceae bacterium]